MQKREQSPRTKGMVSATKAKEKSRKKTEGATIAERAADPIGPRFG